MRGNVDHSEFRGYVFALLFFKRISDIYLEEIRSLTAQIGDEQLARDPRMHNFIVPDACLWNEVARISRNELGTALNEAMIAIERANQPKFDGILTNKIDFNKADELPREKLINLINHFGGGGYAYQLAAPPEKAHQLHQNHPLLGCAPHRPTFSSTSLQMVLGKPLWLFANDGSARIEAPGGER